MKCQCAAPTNTKVPNAVRICMHWCLHSEKNMKRMNSMLIENNADSLVGCTNRGLNCGLNVKTTSTMYYTLPYIPRAALQKVGIILREAWCVGIVLQRHTQRVAFWLALGEESCDSVAVVL